MNGDLKGFFIDDMERASKRKDVEETVRSNMPYDSQKHETSVHYEREVQSTVSKRMRNT